MGPKLLVLRGDKHHVLRALAMGFVTRYLQTLTKL